MHQAVSKRGAGESCAESVWMVQPMEGDVTQVVSLQEVDELSGVVILSGRMAKKMVRQGCAVEMEVSFIEHWSTEEGLEVCVDWWVVPKGFAKCHLPGCGKGGQVIQGMSRQKNQRSRCLATVGKKGNRGMQVSLVQSCLLCVRSVFPTAGLVPTVLLTLLCASQ